MVTINIPTDGSVTRIPIGRRGENEATQIIFDVTHFIETFGNGSAVLLAKRSQDEASYPVAVVRDETTVTWLVNNADTAYQGNGKAELYWYVDDVLAKSLVYSTFVAEDIGDPTEPPEPQQAWTEAFLAEVNEIISDAEESMDGKVTEAQGYADSASQSAEAAAESAQEAAEILANTIYIGNDGNFYIRGE